MRPFCFGDGGGERLCKLLTFIFLCVLCVAGSGCFESAAWLDAGEERSAAIQKARSLEAEGDYDGAIEALVRAVEANPSLILAHLNAALLLHDHKKDYVPAVYHYQRYLKLRPNCDKREMIENRIRLAKQAFAAAVLRPDQYTIDRVMTLEADNKVLKAQVEDLKGRLADARATIHKLTARPAGGGSRTAAGGGGTAHAGAGATAGSSRTYRVKRGDTLSSIANDIYGSASQWRKIRDANNDVLKGSTRVIEGQVLKIP